MKNISTNSIVADGADRLRRARASSDPQAGTKGESWARRTMDVIRRLLCLPSIPKPDSTGGPSPYSLFNTRPTGCSGSKANAQQAGASDGDKPSC